MHWLTKYINKKYQCHAHSDMHSIQRGAAHARTCGCASSAHVHRQMASKQLIHCPHDRKALELCPVASETGGRGRAEPRPHFRAFLTSHAMNTEVYRRQQGSNALTCTTETSISSSTVAVSSLSQNFIGLQLRQYTALFCRARTYTTAFGPQNKNKTKIMNKLLFRGARHFVSSLLIFFRRL